MRIFVLLFGVLVTFSAAARAEDKPQFHRTIAVRMLGYEPDRFVPERCETASNTAVLVRVALLKKQPQEDEIKLYLNVAALIGEARTVCDVPTKAPEFLEPFVKEGEKLPKSVCEAAGEVLVGRIGKAIDDRAASEHPDPLAGYIYGVVRALPPIVDACYEHVEAWARLKTQLDLLTMRERSQREGRACTLWRRAYYDELKKASDVADAQGRAAGLAYLKGKPLVALAGSRSYCSDDLGKAFEMSNYDLTRTVIEASPETPEAKQ